MKSFERTGTWFLIGTLVAVAFVAGASGWAIGHDSGKEEQAPAPAGTVAGAIPQTTGGENVPVAAIGDPNRGEVLFTSKGCSGCHAYAGSGGVDAPPLDFMAGRLSPQQIAAMSGVIWNHVPAMLPHFKEEGVRFPTFRANQMANLLAYLHGGKGAAASGTTAAAGGEELFSSTCGSCHTLAAAGATGAIGPNLDDLAPSTDQVVNAIDSAPGAMPAGLLAGADAKAVAEYVSQNAGK